MRSEVYAKAARLLAEARVALEDETENAAWYRVRGERGDHVVRLAADNRFSCTCTYASLAPGGTVCSHVAAAILHRVRSGDASGASPPPGA